MVGHPDPEHAGGEYRTTAVAIAPQSMKKNAATASTWNAVIATVVIVLIPARPCTSASV